MRHTTHECDPISLHSFTILYRKNVIEVKDTFQSPSKDS